jgi:myo-inositol 2-dehydrogenase/D-chiro-inositol 1-dehydrogenase
VTVGANDTVGIGFIGAGSIAAYHLDGLAAAGGARVRAIAARSPTRAGPLASRYGIPDVATDWRAVLDRRDVEAVIIATPDDTHREIACAAAQAGKAVMLQKPMARNVTECREIIAAARRTGAFLQVSFMHRYFEEVVRLREILAGGRAGKVFAVRQRNATPGPDWGDWFYSKALIGGGVVLQLGVHGIDLLRHVFGAIESVSATIATLKTERRLADGRVVRPDNEDHCLASYRFASGALGSHEIDFTEIAGTDRFSMEVYCENATIWLRTVRGALALYAPELTGLREWIVPDLPRRRLGERHHAEFLDMVRGRVARDTTAEDGLASLVMIEAIYRAASSRREERVGAPS